MTAHLDARRPLAASLADWVAVGVFTEGDAMVAAALADLAGITPDTDPSVVLALALAVRAPRSGHVAVDLTAIRDQVLAEMEQTDPDSADAAAALDWPVDSTAWLRTVTESGLCVGEGSPLVVDLDLVYLRRFHAHETRVADAIRALATSGARPLALMPLVAEVLQLEPGQRTAVERCLVSQLGVLTGGPGTGKTRTVAALLAVILDGSVDASGAIADVRIALAAPTGKAAARMGESLAEAVGLLESSGDARLLDIAGRIGKMTPSTIHRLLGVRPGGAGFRHDTHRRLPHQVVIIDEASMVSLPLMDAVLDALAVGARLVLVGDAGQLASVDAGSVLGDIAGAGGAVGECVAELTESRRFRADSRIGMLAAAIRSGDAASATRVLGEPANEGADGVRVGLVPTLASVADDVSEHARHLADAGRRGDAVAAVAALDDLRVLCAHRRGRAGVAYWTRLTEDMIRAAGFAASGMYPGRPVIVTRNDPARGLFNGDVGVVVRTADGVRVAFAAEGEPRLIAPSHLDAVETVHAMTIHKSQGSEFDHVVVVLPSADSRLATRELLYTAVTRARREVTLVGDATTVAAAIARRAARTSGLVRRLN